MRLLLPILMMILSISFIIASNGSPEDSASPAGNSPSEDPVLMNDQVSEDTLDNHGISMEIPDELAPFNSVIDSFTKIPEKFVSTEYSLHDITGDGIAELWIISGTCEANKILYVYTIIDDEPVLILKHSGDHSYFCIGDNKVIKDQCFCGGGFVVTYEYKKGKIVISKPIAYSLFNEEGLPKAEKTRQQKKLDALFSECKESMLFYEVKR